MADFVLKDGKLVEVKDEEAGEPDVRALMDQGVIPSSVGGVPGSPPISGDMDERKSSVLRGALLSPGGVAAPAMGALGGAISPQGAAADFGGAGMGGAIRALMSKIPGAQGAGAAAQFMGGAGSGAGEASGMIMGPMLQKAILGEPVDIPSGGRLFTMVVPVGATTGLLGVAGTKSTNALMNFFNAAPAKATFAALNRLSVNDPTGGNMRKLQLSEEDFGMLRPGFVRPGQAATRAMGFTQNVINELFPSDVTGEQLGKTMNRVGKKFEAAFPEGTLQGKLTGEVQDKQSQLFDMLQQRTALGQKLRDRYNISTQDAARMDDAFKNPPQQFVDKMFAGDIQQSARRLKSLVDIVGRDDQDIKLLANEWVRKKLLGSAVNITAANVEGGRVLSGEAFHEQVSLVGEELNQIFGPDVTKGLQKLSELMARHDPAKIANSSFLEKFLTGNFVYSTRHAAFAATVGGFGAGAAGLAGASVPMATMSVAALGLAPLVAATILNPSLAMKLERATADPTGQALTAFMRQFASGEPINQVEEALAPRSGR